MKINVSGIQCSKCGEDNAFSNENIRYDRFNDVIRAPCFRCSYSKSFSPADYKTLKVEHPITDEILDKMSVMTEPARRCILDEKTFNDLLCENEFFSYTLPFGRPSLFGMNVVMDSDAKHPTITIMTERQCKM